MEGVKNLNIAGYVRISVDDELDKDNTSIENQIAIIKDFVKRTFPASKLTFYQDRDRSGYTFEQREGYQEMRREFEKRKYDILIIKDFSRFSRRNGRGLVELEDLRDMGLRIISIGDSIDYPTNDDWLAIQIHFFVNEMPVTDTSKKVRNVIQRRQLDGKWVCSVPYGYVITNSKTMTFEIDEVAADVVRKIFDLYNQGWGYKKISNYLTDTHIPTPRMLERDRKEAKGEECKLKVRSEWSIITIQKILENDFYIGTLRQHKYSRKKINGEDTKTNETDHIIFENNHTPIVDYHVFALAQENRQKRTTSCYRGIKINDNSYSGYLFCGDCGSPMFPMSRRDLRSAYRCGAYHRRGLKGCTSHHTRVDILDELLKSYIEKVKENSSDMLEKLEESIKNEKENIQSTNELSERLADMLDAAKAELKATKRQKIKELMKRPDQEELIEETYAELETELENKIDGLQNQINLSLDKHNTIIRANRVAKTVIDIFNDILEKPNLDKVDIGLIVNRILVYENHIEIELKNDIDMLLQAGTLEENQNFLHDTKDNLLTHIVQTSTHRKDKVLSVNVINEGDPLEIYTENDGTVIFKKYSPIGELGEFATQYAESLSKAVGLPACITDKDNIIAVSGVPKKELHEKKISGEIEKVMEDKTIMLANTSERSMQVVDGNDKYTAGVVAPIIFEGDSIGTVIFMTDGNSRSMGEVESKLAETAAGFLGKTME